MLEEYMCVCVCVCVCILFKNSFLFGFVIVQLLSHVWLFVTPWTAAHQTSLSLLKLVQTWASLLKLMSIESLMPSNHLILCHLLLSCLQSFPASESFLFIIGGWIPFPMLYSRTLFIIHLIYNSLHFIYNSLHYIICNPHLSLHPFSSWLASLSMIISSCIYVVANGIISFFFMVD